MEETNPTSLLPKANAAPGVAEPEREEENLRVADRADVRKTAPEDLLEPGAAAPRLQAAWWGGWCVGRNPPQAPGGLGLFSGPLERSAPRGLRAGRGHSRPWSILRRTVCLACSRGGSVLSMLEGFPGVPKALCSSTGGSPHPPSDWAESRAGHCQAPGIQGFGR